MDCDNQLKSQSLNGSANQINNLRAALPTTIAPLVSLTSPDYSRSATPSQVYTSFATNAIKTSYEVRQLRDAWTDERTTQILERVQDSASRNGNVQTFDWGIKGEQGVKTEDLDDKHNGTIVKQEPDLEVQTQEEDEGEVVDSFGDAFRGTKIIEVDRNSEGHINVAVRMRFGRSESLRFTVQRTASRDQDNWYYRAACMQGMTPKIRESITRCLEARPRTRDLNATVVCRIKHSSLHAC